MLIYSKDRLVPTDVNMLVLKSKDEEDRYFYIHRSLYDQAVILTDIYGDDKERLIKDLTGLEQSRDDVDYFWEHTPVPIRIFAPYLLLVKEPIRKFKDMVGAIHVMSGPTNLRGLLKVDVSFRNNPTFSLSISEEYQLAWDRFFLTTMPYGAQMQPVMSQTGWAPMNGTATVTAPLDATRGTAAMSDDDDEVIEISADNLDLGELSTDNIAVPDDMVLDLDSMWDDMNDMSPEDAKALNDKLLENNTVKGAVDELKKEDSKKNPVPAPVPVAPPVATPVEAAVTTQAAPVQAKPAKLNMGLL